MVWVHDLDPIDQWHRGSVVLVGDAAHAALPSSGQGATQALVDSVELVRRLSRRSSELESPLVEFTRSRREETSALTRQARQF
jgi:FAD-dependent urate hydroxylase